MGSDFATRKQTMKAVIDVAKDFSDVPAGRFNSDGPFSGEAFREKHLRPALEKGGTVTIDLDGSEGYGSSFLEEAFGGLVRKGYFTKEELHSRLKPLSDDASLVGEVWRYIDNA